MKDLSAGISLEKAFPLTDEAGEQTTPYKFKVTNTCNTGIDYNVNIEVLEKSTMEAKNIAAKLDNENKVVLTEDNITETIGATDYEAKEAYHISQGKLEPNESKEHEIRIWMDESAGNDAQKGIFSAKVVISGKQNEYAIYKEPLLHGADPVITGDLVPVIIEEDGKVLRANEHFNWYCYEDKEWANAVILKDKTKTYGYYEEIPEDNIESYFVWIPKYRYKLFDMGDYAALVSSVQDKGPNHPIEIEFGLEDTIDDETNEEYKQCATPMNDDKTQGLSGQSGECHLDDWMTHPAFISFDVNGFWVGKFETSKTSTNTIQVKPNQYSWTNINVLTMFNNSYTYQRTLESHMMKNTEWGAVAYLTQSKYGRCNNNTCEEVRMNNSGNYMTGVAAKNKPTTGGGIYNEYPNTTPNQNNDKSWVYTDPNSVIASSTGNYSGIYDLNGGTWEHVMGVEVNYYGQSGWNANSFKIEKKYYDEYIAGAETQFTRRILGDATGELGSFGTSNTYKISSFYQDLSRFIVSDYPIFYRGGRSMMGIYAGIFAFSQFDGRVDPSVTFRIVLAPQESK